MGNIELSYAKRDPSGRVYPIQGITIDNDNEVYESNYVAMSAYGTAKIIIENDTKHSSLEPGWGLDLIRFKIPSAFDGSKIAIELATKETDTPVGATGDSAVVLSIPVLEANKGKWCNLDVYANQLRRLRYFRFVSDAASGETADRNIEYELG